MSCPLTTSQGTNTNMVAHATMQTQRDQFCIFRSATPNVTVIKRFANNIPSNRPFGSPPDETVTKAFNAAMAMNRKMNAMTVTPLGRFMTRAAYSRLGVISIR